MLVIFKAWDRPCSKMFYALVALKILFLNSPSARWETESLMLRVHKNIVYGISLYNFAKQKGSETCWMNLGPAR